MHEWESRVAVEGNALMASKPLRVIELVGVFVVGASAILSCMAIWGDGPVSSILSVWAANLLMLAVIYWGLRRRGQSWSHLGLRLGRPSLKSIVKAILQSIPVFAAAIVAFVAGAILMANLVGMPEPADMSKYNYLQGNLPMTIFALGSVYVVSAFAEEVIYRGFLITRMRELADSKKPANRLAVVVSALLFGLVHFRLGNRRNYPSELYGFSLGCILLDC